MNIGNNIIATVLGYNLIIEKIIVGYTWLIVPDPVFHYNIRIERA